MKKLFTEYNDLKVCIYNNERVIVENYKTLTEIESEIIIIDNIKIIGKKMKVAKLDILQMEIHGAINEIHFI